MEERLIYAGLADAVYGITPDKNHETSIHPGWSQIQMDYDGDGEPEGYYEQKDLLSNPEGFGAAAYTDGDKVIISYRGTYDALDWITGNIGIFFDKVMRQPCRLI